MLRRLLVLTAASLVLAAPALAAEPGVVPDLSWGITADEQRRESTLLREMGARWARIHVQWKHVEPALPGTYDPWWLAHLDGAVAAARDGNAKVVLMVYDAPAWSSGSAQRSTPRDPADYARFVAMLAGRYAGQVAAYEIWNEQNTSRFWTSPSPTAYTTLLAAAHRAVKDVDPVAKVVFGGLSTNDFAYVEAALAAGAGPSFDALAVHPYGYCGTEAPDVIRRGADGRLARDSFLGYREVRASMLARGIAKPIWVTEFGWTTTTVPCNPGAGVWQGGVSEAAQAEYLGRAFRLFDLDPYVQVAIAYNLRNNYWSLDADDPESRYGLLYSDFSPKPAYAAFQTYAGGTSPEPPTAPAEAPSVRLTSPVEGAVVRGSISMTATATDDERVTKVVFWVNDTLVASDTTAPYSATWKAPRKAYSGTYWLSAVAYDAGGRVDKDVVTITRSR